MHGKNVGRTSFGRITFGCPYPSNGTETSLDVALWTFSKTFTIILNCQQLFPTHNFEELTKTLQKKCYEQLPVNILNLP